MKTITAIALVFLAVSLFDQAESAQLVKKWQEKQLIKVI